MQLNHLSSLITYVDNNDVETCLGYLMNFPGHGLYDATLGKVEVSKEDANTHNGLLDAALIEGLDSRCEIGQGGTFYALEHNGRKAVKTFCAPSCHSRCESAAKS